MKTRSIIVALGLLAVLSSWSASAQASTEAERRAWARSEPRVVSHGRVHDNLCVGRSVFRRDSGEWAEAWPNTACSDVGTYFPVHRDARVGVKARPEVRAVSIAVRVAYDTNAVRDLRRCDRAAPGRFECSMPPPGEGRGPARLTLAFPGARSVWTFDYDGHRRTEH